jgi:hypothetical protein
VQHGETTLLFPAALKRHRVLANVPTLPELALSDEIVRETLRLSQAVANKVTQMMQ